MKKIFCLLLCSIVLMTVMTGCSGVKQFTVCTDIDPADAVVVSFNVAAPWGNLKQGTSGQRVKRFAAYMNAVRPDSIGTQEMNADWLAKLKKLMPDYDSYGIVRGGDDNEKKSEMNAILWLKDKYDCIDRGTFWLSETPLEESRYADAGCYRICSFVVLQSKDTGAQYVHMNTHLDNASDEARNFGATVILEKMDVIREHHPDAKIVLTGDFNDTIGSSPYKTITAELTDCMGSTSTIATTYHDWGNIQDSDGPIDFAFTDAKPAGYMVLDDTTNGFVSDHYGILAAINF